MNSLSELSAKTLAAMLDELGRFTSPGAGVTRLVYDAPWREAHRWLADRARAFGLEATSDAAGNLYFHPPDVRPGEDRAALFIGSHIDSVVNGGRFDGALGVVAGLLIAAESKGLGKLPVVGFATCEEDEVRFGAQMMGARVMLGRAKTEELDTVKDAAGITWRQALEEARAAGCAAPLPSGDVLAPPLFKPVRMLELHIEQGPVLEAGKLAVGIVDHIAGYRRLRATITGEARHSGTTPAKLRHDALAAAAEMILAAEALALESDDASRVTAGNARPTPGLFNVVPGECELWLEVRHVLSASLDALAKELDKRCRAIATRRGVRISIESPSGLAPTPLAREIADMAANLARNQKIPNRRLASGAGHDTMVFAQAGVPACMVFVPSQGGISHAPEEFTSPEALWDGYRFTRELAQKLAEQGA